MITVEKVDTSVKSQVNRFVQLPYRLYKDHPNWVPPLFVDARLFLNRSKHPFYEHSTADFFIAVRDGRDVARVVALENRRFNEYHDTKVAQFYLFDCEDDQEAVNALFERVFEWARKRGLNEVVGYVLPLRWEGLHPRGGWKSGKWTFRDGYLFLVPGDSPMGFRLPLDALPWAEGQERRLTPERDLFEERAPLGPAFDEVTRRYSRLIQAEALPQAIQEQHAPPDEQPSEVVRTAL